VDLLGVRSIVTHMPGHNAMFREAMQVDHSAFPSLVFSLLVRIHIQYGLNEIRGLFLMQLYALACCDSGASLFVDVCGIVNNPTLLAYLMVLFNLLVYTFD